MEPSHYHGKTRPPKQMEHKTEIDVVVTRSDEGIVPTAHYVVRNVTGKYASKGDDTLHYCLEFQPKHRLRVDSIVCIVRVAQSVQPTRGGRAECGFAVTINPINSPVEDKFFCSSSGWSIVYSVPQQQPEDGFKRYADKLFFSLCNTNIDPSPNSLPVWRLGVDDSCILGVHNERWVPLRATHPDPAVDPGVPIELRPQRSPGWYWFRSDCSNFELFKGKLSGTRWWKFFGGDTFDKLAFINDALKDFKGNHMTRFGREYESAVALAYLAANPQVTLKECGTYPHTSIPDVTATPDAIINDPRRTFASLPPWYKKLCVDRGLDSSINWSTGIFECKVMLMNDKKKNGPCIRPDHICQMYAEMICTGTYWGQLVRYCHELNECRAYRVYCKPELVDRILKCIVRMRNEMISGTPYNVAVDHDTCREIIVDFQTQANYYNDPKASPVRYATIPWPKDDVFHMFEDVRSRDIIANMPDATDVPTIKQLNEGTAKPLAKSGKKTKPAAAVVVVAPAVAPTITLGGGGVKRSSEMWADIEATTRVMTKSFKNGDADLLISENVIKGQIIRLVDLEVQIAMEAAMKRPKLMLMTDVEEIIE